MLHSILIFHVWSNRDNCDLRDCMIANLNSMKWWYNCRGRNQSLCHILFFLRIAVYLMSLIIGWFILAKCRIRWVIPLTHSLSLYFSHSLSLSLSLSACPLVPSAESRWHGKDRFRCSHGWLHCRGSPYSHCQSHSSCRYEVFLLLFLLLLFVFCFSIFISNALDLFHNFD